MIDTMIWRAKYFLILKQRFQGQNLEWKEVMLLNEWSRFNKAMIN